MEAEELERRLKGNVGAAIVYSTDSENYVGSIWVHKRSRGPVILEDFAPESDFYKKVSSKDYKGRWTLEDFSQDSERYKRILEFSQEDPEQYEIAVELNRDAQERWILVLIWEVDRTKYRGPDYIYEPEDSRKHEVHHFRLISEVQTLLNSLGFSIVDFTPWD
jgi:hypothetical protein